MGLGLVCQFVVQQNGKLKNILDERHVKQMSIKSGKYSDADLIELYRTNAQNLLKQIGMISSKYSCYRISSELFPMMDAVSEHLWCTDENMNTLKQCGDVMRKHGTRWGMHPGQFCILSSDHQHVVDNALTSLRAHAKVMNMFCSDNNTLHYINIHGGKSDRAANLSKQINMLPSDIKSRLTLENCELCYSVEELLPVHLETGVPITFDLHHHNINPGHLTVEMAVDACIESWGNIKPVMHISNSKPDVTEINSVPERRSHSDYIEHCHPYIIELLKSDVIDLEIEAKAKNLAVDKFAKTFNVMSHPMSEQ